MWDIVRGVGEVAVPGRHCVPILAHAVTALRPEGLSGLLCPFWKSDSAALESLLLHQRLSVPALSMGWDLMTQSGRQHLR